MARFVALILRPDCYLAGALIILAATSAWAQAPMMTAPTPPTSVRAPATNAPPAPPSDTLGQYGKILAPGDQIAHPLKLKLPSPDAGEVKIPTQDQLTARDKLEALAKLTDAQIHTQLEKWPVYAKMSLRDQGAMLQRIQDFRDYRSSVARGKAHDMGLLTLTPDQQTKFEKEYWDKRLQMDRELATQFTPIYKAREQKLQTELYRKYSEVSQGPMAQAPKPVAPVVTKLAPAKALATVPATNSTVMPMPPMAQGPR